MSGYEIGRTILECKSCRILDLIEAHSCIGRFKQGVIEQYISLKPGEEFAGHFGSRAFVNCLLLVCVCVCVYVCIVLHPQNHNPCFGLCVHVFTCWGSPHTYTMNGGFVFWYISIVRLVKYFYLILQNWPTFANSAIFAAKSFTWQGNHLKRGQHEGHSFIQHPQQRHWEDQPAT